MPTLATFIQHGIGSFCYSVTQSCLTLCNPVDCSTPGFPVLHHLLEFAQTRVHWVSDAIQSSHSLSSPSPPAQSSLASQSFIRSQLFASGGQSTGVSASTSVFPMNTQGWSPGRVIWSLLFHLVFKSTWIMLPQGKGNKVGGIPLPNFF